MRIAKQRTCVLLLVLAFTALGSIQSPLLAAESLTDVNFEALKLAAPVLLGANNSSNKSLLSQAIMGQKNSNFQSPSDKSGMFDNNDYPLGVDTNNKEMEICDKQQLKNTTPIILYSSDKNKC